MLIIVRGVKNFNMEEIQVGVEMGSRMGGKEKKEGQVEMIFPLLRLNLYDGWTARHIKYQTKY